MSSCWLLLLPSLGPLWKFYDVSQGRSPLVPGLGQVCQVCPLCFVSQGQVWSILEEAPTGASGLSGVGSQVNARVWQMVSARFIQSDRFGTFWHWTSQVEVKQNKETIVPTNASVPSERVFINLCPSSTSSHVNQLNSSLYNPGILELLPPWWSLEPVSLCANLLRVAFLSPSALLLSQM